MSKQSTNVLNIKIADSIEDAPTYNQPEYKGAVLTDALIVAKGMESGKPSVDLIFTDAKGQKYIAMSTFTLIEGLSAAMSGVAARNKNTD